MQVQAALIGSLDKIVDHLTKSFVIDEIMPLIASERLTYSTDTVAALIGKVDTVTVQMHCRAITRD